MAYNIMEPFNKQWTAATVGAVARMLGEDESKTASGVAGVYPVVLGGLLEAAAGPEGEQALGRAIEQADPGLVSNIRVALRSSGRYAMIKTGLSQLGSFIGAEERSAAISAIASYSGLSEASSKSLLGLATPFAISMLAREGNAQGLDADEVVGVLKGQKDNIAHALPDDLGRALSGSPLLRKVLGGAPTPELASEPAAAPEPAPEPAPAPAPAPEPAPKSAPEPAITAAADEPATQPVSAPEVALAKAAVPDEAVATAQSAAQPGAATREAPKEPGGRRWAVGLLVLLVLAVVAAGLSYQFLD